LITGASPSIATTALFEKISPRKGAGPRRALDGKISFETIVTVAIDGPKRFKLRFRTRQPDPA
jgi:hypothetical protein